MCYTISVDVYQIPVLTFSIEKRTEGSIMDIFSIITLLGGLALFLYGMSLMSSGLEKLAGGRLQAILRDMTSSKVKSLMLGLGVTAVIQSSSAVTVMLVGLVNSGIMSLEQSVGAIMGSNIGTTVTAWILSLIGVESDNALIKMLKPESFSPLLALLGVVMIMITKSDKKRNAGLVLVGFALLMYGMGFMSSSMAPLSDSPKFTSLMTTFNNPILGLLAGLLITAVIQSSSASVGILQALSMTNGLTYGIVIPIIMGQNIGTCVTSLISSVGVSRNARRVAAVHISFNVIGTIIFMVLFYLGHYIIGFAFIDKVVGPVNIAVAHSFFNLFTTVMLYPFSNNLVNISNKVVKYRKGEQEEHEFLDSRLLHTPTVAVEEANRKMKEMLEMAFLNFKIAVELSNHWDDTKFREMQEREERIDYYEDQLSNFNVKLATEELTDVDSTTISMMLHAITDAERIGDRALNIAESIKELNEKNLSFSKEASNELNKISAAIKEIISHTMNCFIDGDLNEGYLVEPIEEVIDDMTEKSRDNHVLRLRRGECTIELGFILNDILINMERISDHCSNIARDKIELSHNNLHMHEYIRTIKEQKDPDFLRLYKHYSEKYSL